MVKSAQVERNVRLKNNRKMARSLETEAAVRNALKHWKIGGFRDDVVEIQKCHLPPNIQRIGIAPSFGTEVALFHAVKNCFVTGVVVRVVHTHGNGNFVICRVADGLCAAPSALVYEWS